MPPLNIVASTCANPKHYGAYCHILYTDGVLTERVYNAWDAPPPKRLRSRFGTRMLEQHQEFLPLFDDRCAPVLGTRIFRPATSEDGLQFARSFAGMWWGQYLGENLFNEVYEGTFDEVVERVYDEWMVELCRNPFQSVADVVTTEVRDTLQELSRSYRSWGPSYEVA